MSDDVPIIPDRGRVTTHQLRTRTGDGRDMVVESGYILIRGTDMQGNADGTWNRKDLQFRVGPRWRNTNAFDIVPIVSMTSIMNVNVANNAGWAVDDCRVWETQVPTESGIVRELALRCRLAVRDRDGFMFRVNYHVTMIGELA